MEEENKGLTLKDICKTIWLKKWLALIVAVAVALACAILIYYAYNPRVKNYEMEFSLNLPGGDKDAFYSYPDGTLFYYSDLTSATTLKGIKENGNFSNVNVEKMVKNGDISITRDVTVTPLSTDGSSVYKETVYKITAKTKYFSDINQAKEFLTSIAEYPAEYLKSMVINYNLIEGLDDYDAATQNNMLKEQLEFIEQEYDSLITTYGKTFVVDGKTLNSYAKEVTAYKGIETYDVETVTKFIETFESTSRAVYAKATSAAYIQPSIVVVNGGMGLTKVLLISVVVGVVIALIAAYVVGYLSLKKKKAANEAPSEDAPQGQPAVEAETTQTENKE